MATRAPVVPRAPVLGAGSDPRPGSGWVAVAISAGLVVVSRAGLAGAAEGCGFATVLVATRQTRTTMAAGTVAQIANFSLSILL